jgi:hypothetical protein
MIAATPAFAQGWTFDARKIGMGNAGGADHPASRMIDEERSYRAIVIPLGLFQVFENMDIFKPDSDEFDIVRAIELAASPLHYQFGRGEDSDAGASGRRLVRDIRNAELSRDLNAYRGFAPSQQPAAEGLAHAAFGKTFIVSRGANGASHGIFVGGGPYFSMRSAGDIDPDLIRVLESDTNLYLPNTQMDIGIDNRAQLAVAITGGYRGRFGLPQARSERDGVYVAVDYHHLLGLLFEDSESDVRLDTDAAGLLTVNPLTNVRPLFVGRDSADSGQGLAIDVGLGFVSGPIELGFGVKGIANRINWSDVERTTYSLNSLITGDDEFIETPAVPIGEVRTELPQDYRGYAGVRAGATFFVGEFANGFNGNSFRGGVEQSLGAIEARGGIMYSREKWNPTGGVGFDFSPRVSLDVAAFGTTANVERKRRLAIALSLRLNATGN